MAYEILNTQYPPRKPLLTIEADSLDELPTEGVAEGSTATVGGEQYVYENNSGWVTPGSGGGSSGGGGGLVIGCTVESAARRKTYTLDKTGQEIYSAVSGGQSVVFKAPITDTENAYHSISFIASVGDEYYICFNEFADSSRNLIEFSATSESPYPVGIMPIDG